MKYTQKTIVFKSIKDMPCELRPRERMLRVGPQGLGDLELMCIILGTGGRGKPVQEIAEKILREIDSLKEKPLIPEALKDIQGLGEAKISAICAALELGRRLSPAKKRILISPEEAYSAIRHFGDRKQEHFLSIMLNGAHELMGVDLVSVGLVNRTLVHPREVFSQPLKLRSTAIILAHNHPSGNLEPSKDDLEVTGRLRRAGEILGIQVLDHLIFNDTNFRSLLESGEF